MASAVYMLFGLFGFASAGLCLGIIGMLEDTAPARRDPEQGPILNPRLRVHVFLGGGVLLMCTVLAITSFWVEVLPVWKITLWLGLLLLTVCFGTAIKIVASGLELVRARRRLKVLLVAIAVVAAAVGFWFGIQEMIGRFST